MTDWDSRFLEMSKLISTWSKDPSTKVGAIIVDTDNRVISMGYNGFAKNVDDKEDRLQDRDIKLKITVHAEMNAIIFAQTNVSGMTLYTWPFMPCSNCASMIIQSGISRVVAPVSDNPRWKESFELSQQIFKEASVQVDLLNPQDINF